MIMNTLQKIVVGPLAALFLVTALPAVASDPAKEQKTEPNEGPVRDQTAEISIKPYLYKNEGGNFQIIFPGGCGKLNLKINQPDLFAGENWDDIIQVTHAYCNRYEQEGEGCSVTANFNLHGEDGSIAGPEHVVRGVESTLGKFGAGAVSQKVIKKEFDNGIIAEGVEVYAQPEEGPGEVWVRGLLVEGDVYILAAWNKKGGVWANPDYITFFKSFQPWTD